MENSILYDILIPFVTSFFLSLLLTYLVRYASIKLKWISVPREDRWNTRIVALMGGIAVFLSFIITGLFFQLFDYLMIAAGAVLVFGIGFWDDRFELTPVLKFLGQFLAASVIIAGGFSINSSWPFWVAIPLTYFWVIGITNAFNLLDNMDGLAAGIAVIVSTVLGVLALKLNMSAIAVLSFSLAGAVGGFLVLNYYPAKIFMGDCGSLFIGYLLAAFPLMLEPALVDISPVSIVPVFMALAIIPIFDTTLVTFVRIFKGRSPSQGGSDHSSHRLVFSGLSEKAAVNTLFGISMLFGIAVILFYPDYLSLFYSLFTIGIAGLIFFGLYLSRLDVYEDEKLSTLESMVSNIPAYFKRKVQLAVIIVDIALIIASFALAHFIRFEGWSVQVEEAVTEVLPGVIVLKILILAALGLYKSVWKYAGVADLMRLFIATLAGSLLAGVFSWIYAGGYLSVSVFAVDWFLLLFLLSGSRFAFKGMRRLFAMSASGGRNVLIYGAGDAGWLALSEIRQNPDLRLDPVGFLDDSPYKQKGNVQGLNILGSYHNLLSVCEEYEVDEVLICIRELSRDKKEMVKNMCEKGGIICREFSPAFNDLDSGKAAEEKSYNFEFQN